MDMTLDIFDNDAFGLVPLTEAINVLPIQYQRIGQMGLFKPRPVSSSKISIEYRDGRIVLIQSQPRGSRGSFNESRKRHVRTFEIPHFPLEDVLTAEDVQGVRKFGSASMVQGVQEKVLEKLAEMKEKHDITHEYMRSGAIKGVVVDADGSTIVDLFSEFGVTQEEVDFTLGTTTTDVGKKCREIKRHIEKNIGGDRMSGIHALCSPEWFDKFIAHKSVVGAYNLWNAAGHPVRDDMRGGFKFQGIVFEEYVGSATDADDNVRDFIPEGDVRFFPTGTSQVFRNFIAPADFLETANTLGKEFYAKQEKMQFNRGVEIHTQSNRLSICTRPQVLVRGHSSN